MTKKPFTIRSMSRDDLQIAIARGLLLKDGTQDCTMQSIFMQLIRRASGSGFSVTNRSLPFQPSNRATPMVSSGFISLNQSIAGKAMESSLGMLH